MRSPRLRDTDGTPYDPETGERVSGASAEPLVWRVGFDRSADESLPVYDYWTSQLSEVGLLEDPETMSMVALFGVDVDDGRD